MAEQEKEKLVDQLRDFLLVVALHKVMTPKDDEFLIKLISLLQMIDDGELPVQFVNEAKLS